MKKVLSVVITLVLCISMCAGLASCGNKSDSDKMYTIGINQFGTHGSLDNCREGFIEGLKEEGFVEGENIKFDIQNANFDASTANLISQTFVSNNADMICAIATPSAQSAYNAASETNIPVIYTAVTAPELAGLTSGNVTGTSDKLPVEAQLKMIRAILPDAKTIGILYTTSEKNSEYSLEEYKTKAPEYGFEIVASGVTAQSDVPLAAADIVTKVDCITNLTDNTVVGALANVLEAANQAGIPVFGSEIEQVVNGCLAGEGIDYIDLGKQTGRIAAKVLRGEAAAENIDYEIIENSYLYINYETAEKMNIEIPQELRERAVDVNADASESGTDNASDTDKTE